MTNETRIYYAILIAINPYTHRHSGKEYGWIRNDDGGEMTRAQFSRMARRACQRLAERKFVDTLKGGGDVKVFTDKEKFVKEFKSLTGITPRL